MNVKLLLVDDHPMLRKGLRQALSQQPHFVVVGEATSGAQAVALAVECAPDLVVMDIHLSDMNGIEATRQILSVCPATKIVIFSSDAARSRVDDALHAGACGYILKTGVADELVRAVDIVMEGKMYLSPEVNAGILEDYRKGLANESEPAKPFLSDREKQLLRLIAAGQRNKEIAVQLSISTKSVEANRSRLMKKLVCSSSAELIRYAVREGIAAA